MAKILKTWEVGLSGPTETAVVALIKDGWGNRSLYQQESDVLGNKYYVPANERVLRQAGAIIAGKMVAE